MAEAGQRVNPDEYEVFIGYQLEKALTEEQMETVRALMELGGLNREAIRFKSEEMSAFYSIYGGIFFVGMFLAALFLMATVMIIYYKQMSEGYEDQKRFQLVEEIGVKLGRHVAGLINIFNPELVIIGGALSRTGDYLTQPITTAIRKYTLNLMNRDSVIVESKLKERAGIIGACMLSRSKLFE